MDSYKQRVKSDIRSVYIKMSDLRHNSDIRRLKGVGPKDIIRAIEYQAFYQELKEYVINYHNGV
ncbi:hypothetical protein Ah1_00106 [Aeromonas phage Ah1]|uniref:Uncharacterized protein n=1 Tax=Aeromonas phage Ah1 TaxID=2053701 RepID=A0A2H4YEN9_9CAUD|nr:metal-dependent phosphohydrolase [Aeromonas phage Ah1]AUE22647.1 hypothetical protein Ah1_00106 [Aeromonas phage Ah1]